MLVFVKRTFLLIRFLRFKLIGLRFTVGRNLLRQRVDGIATYSAALFLEKLSSPYRVAHLVWRTIKIVQSCKSIRMDGKWRRCWWTRLSEWQTCCITQEVSSTPYICFIISLHHLPCTSGNKKKGATEIQKLATTCHGYRFIGRSVKRKVKNDGAAMAAPNKVHCYGC